MRNIPQLYTLSDDRHLPQEIDVMVHALDSGMDAGNAGKLAARQLTDRLPAQTVATFDIDQLIDYRGRRPSMRFDSGTWSDYDAPELLLEYLRDDEGEPFLLLRGQEPDLKWEAFIEDVINIADTFGVSRFVGIHGIPMGVPHTRPITVTPHATDMNLLDNPPMMFGSVQVPASASSLMHYRIGQQGGHAVGFAANVPHYVAQSSYPPAAAELLRQVSAHTGLSLPVGDLESDGLKVRHEIEQQVKDSSEAQAMVAALEEQFDTFMSTRSDHSGLLPSESNIEIPTADELGEQVEAFLRLGIADPDDIPEDPWA